MAVAGAIMGTIVDRAGCPYGPEGITGSERGERWRGWAAGGVMGADTTALPVDSYGGPGSLLLRTRRRRL